MLKKHEEKVASFQTSLEKLRNEALDGLDDVFKGWTLQLEDVKNELTDRFNSMMNAKTRPLEHLSNLISSTSLDLKETEHKTGTLMSSNLTVPNFETELKEIQDSYSELHPENQLNQIRDKFKAQVEKIRIMPKFKRVGNLNIGEIMEVVEESEVNMEDLKTKSYWNTER